MRVVRPRVRRYYQHPQLGFSDDMPLAFHACRHACPGTFEFIRTALGTSFTEEVAQGQYVLVPDMRRRWCDGSIHVCTTAQGAVASTSMGLPKQSTTRACVHKQLPLTSKSAQTAKKRERMIRLHAGMLSASGVLEPQVYSAPVDRVCLLYLVQPQLSRNNHAWRHAR
jgi:hypothetical protein